jgi:predicted alpha/beta-hydrolase family hydrolase
MRVSNALCTRSTFQAKAGVNVTSLLVQPSICSHLLVFGHGAGAPLDHVHMNSICDALANVGIATFRFNFPFMEKGGGRTDNLPTCIEVIDHAVKQGRRMLAEISGSQAAMRKPSSKLLLGGHSFGGRMASHYAAMHTDSIDGLVYFSFPLHPSKKPDTKRALHLTDIRVPQLYLSGTRDSLAEMELLKPIIDKLDNAELVTLDTADHGFKILKRTRISPESVYDEAARALVSWISQHHL